MSRFTYENQGSDRYLLYWLREGEEADTMALEMLSHNKIANLLPVSFIQMNEERYLQYSGLSQTTLKNQMSGTILKDRLLTIFESICDGIITSEEYLLDGNSFVLDAENIYVNRASGKTSLVYLPVLPCTNQTDYRQFFKTVITNAIADPSEDGTYIIKLLYYLNSTENFSLREFSRIVKNQRLFGTARRKTEEAGDAGKAKVKKKAVTSSAQEKEAGKPGSETENREMLVQKQSITGSGEKIKSVQKKNTESQYPEQKQAKKQSGSVKAGDEKSGYGFEVPWGAPAPAKVSSEQENSSPQQEGEDHMSMLELLHNFSGENLEKYRAQRKALKRGKQEETTPENKKEKKGRKEPQLFLLSLDPAHPYHFEVNKNPFRIGRLDSNDAVVQIQSVSKNHCVICREGNSWFIEDKNSKFGTKLDGHVCQPGEKSAAIHNHSVLELPGISFRVEFR